MHWERPSYLWIQIVPVLLFIGWIVSEYLRRRRLTDFGDTQVLGLSFPRVPRIAALLMMVSGLGSTVALLALPAWDMRTAPVSAPEVKIQLDLPSFGPAQPRLWESLETAVRTILERSSGSRFSVLASGWPPEVLVYPTADLIGLQMVVSRVRFEAQEASPVSLAVMLARYAQPPQGGDSPASRVIVVTAAPAEEIEHLYANQRDRVSGLMFARLSAGAAPAEYGYLAENGKLTWTEDPAGLGNRLRPDAGNTVSNRRLSPIQYFALLALFLLSVECLFNLGARSDHGGRFLV
jgi:hypothetical protein